MKSKNRYQSGVVFISLLFLISCYTGSDAGDDKRVSLPIQPSEDYLSRKVQYLDYCSANSDTGGLNEQVCQAYTGAGAYNPTAIYDALNKIDNREDCSDFAMNRILRMLWLDRRNPTLPDTLRNDMKDTVLNFKYWLDEPGPDDMCWWSENHQILFHTAELLAGRLYPNLIFPNSGMTGREHIEHARRLINKWLDYRSRFGFSEWHSNVYFNEDMPALINLVDFAGSKNIRARAAMMLDVLAFDMATNYYKGVFATTHGRTYPDKLIGGQNDSITEAAWIMLNLVDIGSINELSRGNFTATFLATSDNYFTPPLLEKVAEDAKSNIEHRQRDSIDLEEGPGYGISYSDYEDIMFWWGMTGYIAPRTLEGSVDMINHYNLWEGYMWGDMEAILKPYADTQTLMGVAEELKPFFRGAVLETVNTYTYRTPYYQLSGAQDWKQFHWTGQVVTWKATLDKDCFVFTSFPVDLSSVLGANFGSEWTGGLVPRATFYKNVGIIQYHEPALGNLEKYMGSPVDIGAAIPDWVHAYFPKNKFDEYVETGNWVIGRKGDAYLALYSKITPQWYNEYDLRAHDDIDAGEVGTDNVWIVELGDVEHYGSFSNFVTAIENATVHIGSSTHYESPSQGPVEVGWYGPMTVDGAQVDLGPYPRWDNKYAYQEFGTKVTEIYFGDKKLVLDFETPERGLYMR